MKFLDLGDTDHDFKIFGGGKARNLAVLGRAGVRVPEWFCIPSPVLEEYLKTTDLERLATDSGGFSETERRVEEAFAGTPFSPVLQNAVSRKIRDLGWENRFLAVRSSGLDEDSAGNSFAGQFSSFLFVRGEDEISLAIRKCWASAWSERVLRYRQERGLLAGGQRMGVILQLMVDPTSSGVLFTRNPLNPLDRESLWVDSVFGLCEGLVGGDLESDHYEIDRATLTLKKSEIAVKRFLYQRGDHGGVLKTQLDPELSKVPSLNETALFGLGKAALALESLTDGTPQDIEWAINDEGVYFLQMRPITSLPPESFHDSHTKGEEPTLWDNSNIIESYSGVTSPFTFSYASHAYQQVYRQFAEMMQVPKAILQEQEPRFRNMLGLIRGRIYYNLINWYQLLLCMPGSASNPSFMETMMGVKKSLSTEHQKAFDFAKNPPSYGFLFKLRLTIVSLFRFFRSDAIIADFKFHFNRVYGEARQQDFRSWPVTRQISYYLELQRELLPRWRAPIVNDFLCMVFFGVLKTLTSRWMAGEAEPDSLQNDLLCGQGDLESTEPTKFLMRIAESIDSGDPGFKKQFITSSPERVWEDLLQGGNPEVLSKFKEFLDRFGFRCVNELKFEEPDLNDDPAFVIGTVASYIRMKTYSIEKMNERERLIRSAAEARVRKRLFGLRKWIYFWILKHARKAVRNREDLRFDRTKSYGLVRHLMRAVGANLVKLGILDSEFDIFYLTVDEIIAYSEGRLPTHSPRDLVSMRKPVYEEYRKTPSPPDRFVTYGAVGVSLKYPAALSATDLLKDLTPAHDDPSFLFGTPCCPGVIEGVVRVAHDLKDTSGLQGEILVTSRTDPGWVPLYPSCSGLLIERGSLLSHSAVVARELGLPTIVGISGGLMERLKTGQRVRMDAGKGEVRIL
ncbi:MAG: phosphoenolpyruvate synthase [Bdellovibrionales bacterium]|nr:phosphoenolpyruvate synthase [Bdellovibrionales bacterium]